MLLALVAALVAASQPAAATRRPEPTPSPAADDHALCMHGCGENYKPVCCHGRMWHNPCYLKCEMGQDFTAYEFCPSPPPAAVAAASPPPRVRPPSCNPATYPYVNLTYYNPRECRTYTLFDVHAGCMPHWDKARRYCEGMGQELAPWGDSESEDSCRKLCAANRFTCWLGGAAPEGLCNLMTQEGYGVQQGCEQPVRFVCRTKESRCPYPPPPPPQSCYDKCMYDNPWVKPDVPYCDPQGKPYANYSTCVPARVPPALPAGAGAAQPSFPFSPEPATAQPAAASPAQPAAASPAQPAPTSPAQPAPTSPAQPTPTSPAQPSSSTAAQSSSASAAQPASASPAQPASASPAQPSATQPSTSQPSTSKPRTALSDAAKPGAS
ncbi:hypothetical protein HXX76_009376 [Chlamydomonas incerta]|uniref:Uncharacterized protein n=1 Tax=Chlamydomonas incerta TaxID=51695 RepID=A0A835SXP0_CHLIN|nr:hypothetical protein HXX76_009376 [Chlamydomonas incerta]|eukprot:KAG2431883.1 hypothetical protein HXX76_009376 [Chlamydomonas incerta]